MSNISFNKELNIRIKEVPIKKLLPHEKVNSNEVEKIVQKSFHKNNYKIPLIIVCDKTNMIIDGHHRLEALKLLGFTKIPVIYVNYLNEDIICSNTNKISKGELINSALNKNFNEIKRSQHRVYNLKQESWVEIINISNNHNMIISKQNK